MKRQGWQGLQWKQAGEKAGIAREKAGGESRDGRDSLFITH